MIARALHFGSTSPSTSQRLNKHFTSTADGLSLALVIGMNQNEMKPSTLVVLTPTPSRYIEFERFLVGRGWTLRMRNDLKAFLEEVVLHKPEYVLISVDFDTSKLPHLRQLLKQVYRTKIIDFAEEQSVRNWEALKNLPALTRLLGPLTGPSFERLLMSIAQSQEKITPVKNKMLHLHFGIATMLKKKLKSRGEELKYPVVRSAKTTCYQVNAAEFSGHFLVATGDDRPLDLDINAMIRSALSDLVAGVYDCATVPDVEIFEIEIPDVHFKKFAGESAEFLASGLHNGVEVVMAYFPIEGNWLKLEQKDTFVQVDLTQDCVAHPAPCALYLHLPLNNKFVLYVGENKQLEPKQEVNLQNYGITKLYARDEDSPKIRMSRTRHHYAELISQFRLNA